MAEDSDEPTDLFGNPWEEPRDPRGRKAHQRSPEVAEKIAVLRAAGLTVEQIAARSHMSEPTLRKYYLRELVDGSTLAQAALDEVIWAKAMQGNVPAAKFMRDRFAKGEAAVPVAASDARRADPEPAADEEPTGKKAAADKAALTAHEGTEWGEVLKPTRPH